ncbi:hypothetical protein U9M48_002831 [Paspalum notatum var. saurae]|uniref:SBP-type domain-containing protein n=1 Tax=Paspalum notatum var. saurae TaxID=547442 RepID=A0AAQ3PKI2_PASNO
MVATRSEEVLLADHVTDYCYYLVNVDWVWCLFEKVALKVVRCSVLCRFHMLSEFDEGKRSCRKRLDGHNRRRRKPQHDLMNLGGFFPYHQVNQFEVYPPAIPTAGQSSDAVHSVDRQPPFSISFSRTPEQFPFPREGSSMLHTGRVDLHLAGDRSHTGSSTGNNDLSGTLGPECALSLLSSPLHHPSTAGIPTAGQAQFASLLSRAVSVSQAATSVATASAPGGNHHVFVADAVFEDPSQALPFTWH